MFGHLLHYCHLQERQTCGGGLFFEEYSVKDLFCCLSAQWTLLLEAELAISHFQLVSIFHMDLTFNKVIHESCFAK